MDVLDKYKKAWKNQPEDAIKISREEIFKMSHKKSSSIVKWIFIIGLIESFLLVFSYFFFDGKLGNKTPMVSNSSFENIYQISQIISVAFLLFFLFKFYKNWKSISAVDNTKALMTKIIKTRKTVKYYIGLNIFISTLFLLTGAIISFSKFQPQASNKKLFIFILTLIITSIIFIGVLWGIYHLLYGLLLKKLNTNYKELINLDEN